MTAAEYVVVGIYIQHLEVSIKIKLIFFSSVLKEPCTGSAIP